jgi:hypothetical protein
VNTSAAAIPIKQIYILVFAKNLPFYTAVKSALFLIA